MLNQIIICCFIAVCIFYICNTFVKITYIKKYSATDILALFDYFLDHSYKSIYDSDLVTHIVNNVQLISTELETIQRNFIKTTLLYMGKKNKKLFTEFFGDEQTMFINMIRYMKKKLNDDGLSKIISEHNNPEQQFQQNG